MKKVFFIDKIKENYFNRILFNRKYIKNSKFLIRNFSKNIKNYYVKFPERYIY